MSKIANTTAAKFTENIKTTLEKEINYAESQYDNFINKKK